MSSHRLLLPLVLLALLADSVYGAETLYPSHLKEADTTDRIYEEYIQVERKKIIQSGKKYGSTEHFAAMAPVFAAAYERAMEIAQTDEDKHFAYDVKYIALNFRELTGDEDAKKEVETFLKELSETKEFAGLAEDKYFERFTEKAKKTVKTRGDFKTFEGELMQWINLHRNTFEVCRLGKDIAFQCNYPIQQFGDALKSHVLLSDTCTLSAEQKKEVIPFIDRYITEFTFLEFSRNSQETVDTPEGFALFTAELKMWINKGISIFYYMRTGYDIADKNNVSAQEFTSELIAFVQSSDCTLPESKKTQVVAQMEGMVRIALGSDPKLYGKTIDGKDFHWTNLCGKYVLIKFTATWCGPCKGEIPGMLEAYQKYHDKGLEIVSVYIWERGEDSVADVKQAVAKEKLPWIILSGALTAGESVKDDLLENQPLSASSKSAIPQQNDFYGITSIPTMVLTDKEGNVIMTRARGEKLQTKLAEIFE